MEHSSKIEEQMETIKSQMDQIKNPSKNNLKKISEITEKFENATAALLNPIKKLKISYNMRINSFKGKYENVLADVKQKISVLEKNKKAKEIKNFNSIFIEETAQQNTEITREHSKLMNLLEECLQSICALNRLFDTQEFSKLDELTKELSPVKKKSKVPTLELNEDNYNESFGDREELDSERRYNGMVMNRNGKHKAKLNGHSKIKNKSNNNEELDVIALDDFSENENNTTKILANNKNIFKKQKQIPKQTTTNSSSNNNIKSVKSQNTPQKPNKKTTTTNSNTKNTQNLQNNNIDSEAENENLNSKDEKATEDSKNRKLTDEECLEKMKERFPEDKGLTKTFITRKLKKRIAVYRKLDFNDEETFKVVENTIPKKSGPNSFLKVTMEVCNKDDFSPGSALISCIKDLFDCYFIVLKDKQKKMKIVFAGHINKDIISFLKKVSGEEFRNSYSVQTMKIKAYAFYEELVFEFSQKENISEKKINDAEIKDYVVQFNLLSKMRKAYEEIKQIKVDF